MFVAVLTSCAPAYCGVIVVFPEAERRVTPLAAAIVTVPPPLRRLTVAPTEKATVAFVGMVQVSAVEQTRVVPASARASVKLAPSVPMVCSQVRPVTVALVKSMLLPEQNTVSPSVVVAEQKLTVPVTVRFVKVALLAKIVVALIVVKVRPVTVAFVKSTVAPLHQKVSGKVTEVAAQKLNVAPVMPTVMVVPVTL